MFEQLNLAHLGIWYIVFLFSTTFHEFAHAYLSYRGGDLTAYEGGQVSLDPMPHIRRSPFGMVLIPLWSFVQMGWMIGWASTPFDPHWALRNPKKQALMSLAGPCANLLLAAVGIGLLHVLLATGVFVPSYSPSFTQLVALPPGQDATSALGALAMLLSVLVNLNVLLGFFNLLPIPPLDGAGVVEGFAPSATGPFYERLRANAMMQFAGLLIAWWIFPTIAHPALLLVLKIVYPNATFVG